MTPSLFNRMAFTSLEAHSDINQAALGLIGSQAVATINKFYSTAQNVIVI